MTLLLILSIAACFGLGSFLIGWGIGTMMANADKPPRRSPVQYYAPVYRDYVDILSDQEAR